MKKACIIKRTPDGKIDRVFNSVELNKSSVDRLVEKTGDVIIGTVREIEDTTKAIVERVKLLKPLKDIDTGEPMLIYSGREISSKERPIGDEPQLMRKGGGKYYGTFFTPNKSEANMYGYGGDVLSGYLNPKKVFDFYQEMYLPHAEVVGGVKEEMSEKAKKYWNLFLKDNPSAENGMNNAPHTAIGDNMLGELLKDGYDVAVENLSDYMRNGEKNEIVILKDFSKIFIPENGSYSQSIVKAYYKAKADGSNLDLVKTLEQSLPSQESSYKYTNGVSTITYHKTGNNSIEIDLLDTDINERGKGNAKNLLETFLNETDSLGITTTLLISPRDLNTTTEGLEKLYKSVGFVFQRVNDIASDFEMVRPAIPVSQKIREQFSAKKKEDITVQDKETTVLVSEFLKDKLGIDINVLNKENIAKELAKRGYSSLREMVQAWHGSAADFDRFTTEKMGTGEGAQAFGWGLYFTDLKGIAESYAKKLGNIGAKLEIDGTIYTYSADYNDFFNNTTNKSTIFISELNQELLKENGKYYLIKSKVTEEGDTTETSRKEVFNVKNKDDGTNKKLYKVSLHKGKSPSEYTWLEWDKEVTDNIYNTIGKKLKSNGKFLNELFQDSMEFEKTDGTKVKGNRPDGLLLYNRISQILGSDKEASLFLLKNSIDGIKYPAESLSAGRTSDNARGFNYVVFDENAITIDEKIQFSASQAQSNPSYIRNTEEYGVGRDYDTDKVARERFDIPSLKQIGKGSDRTVFGLGDGKVLKVAHTARGLEQNMWEGEYVLSGIQTKVFEKGLNYVVTENVPRAKSSDVVTTYDIETGEENGTATFGQMMKDFDFFSQLAFDDNNPLLQDILRKYDMDVIRNYDVIWADFIAPRNWGYKDGVAYHIDGGTFGGVRMLDRYKGKTNLSDEDFREVYIASKTAKKQFGDKDRYTMFEGNNDVVYGFYDQNTNQIYLTEEYLNSGTLIHENWHLWKPVLNQLANKDKQAKVLLDTMERLVNESGVFNEEALVERYNQGKTSQQSQIDFDMQAASQEANDITLNYNAAGEHLAPNGMPSNLSEEQAKIVRTEAFKNWFGDWENDPQNASKVVDEQGEPLVVYHGGAKDISEFRGNSIFFASDKEVAESYVESQDKGIGQVYPSFINLRRPLIEKGASNNWNDVRPEIPYYKRFRVLDESGEVVLDDIQYELDAQMNAQDIAYDIASAEDSSVEIDDVVPYKYESYYNNENVSTDALFEVATEELGYDGVILDGITDTSNLDSFFATTVVIASNPNQIKLADGSNKTFSPYDNDIRYDAKQEETRIDEKSNNFLEVLNSNKELLDNLEKKGGGLLTIKQAEDLQKEIESKYAKNGVAAFDRNKTDDIRQSLWNYDEPFFGTIINGVDVRVATGIVEGIGTKEAKKTYLLYAEGKIVGKFYSVKDAEAVVNYIKKNLIKQLPNSNNLNFQIIGQQGAKNLADAAYLLNNLSVAKEMQTKGETPLKIKLATGWELNNKKWVYEIDDNLTINNLEVGVETKPTLQFIDKEFVGGNLSEVIDYPTLFEAYPEFKNIQVAYYESANKEVDDVNMFITNQNKIYINANRIRTSGEEMDTERIKQSLLHEITHKVQEIEQFEMGFSQDKIGEVVEELRDFLRNKNAKRDELTELGKLVYDWSNKVSPAVDILRDDKLYGKEYIEYLVYKHLASEVQARAVEKKYGMGISNTKLISNFEDIAEKNKIYIQNKISPSALLSSDVYNPRPNETQQEYISRMKEEIEANLLGDNAKSYFEKIAKDNGLTAEQTKSFLQKLQDWITQFSQWLANQLGFNNITAEQARNLSTKDILDRVTTSMLRGDMRAEEAQQLSEIQSSLAQKESELSKKNKTLKSFQEELVKEQKQSGIFAETVQTGMFGVDVESVKNRIAGLKLEINKLESDIASLKNQKAVYEGKDNRQITMFNVGGQAVATKPIVDEVEVVNGFYSPLEKIIIETKFDKLPAKQWVDKFAKGEEAKWTGLADWLSQQQGSVSKADIQNYLKDNRIEIVEVVKGGEQKVHFNIKAEKGKSVVYKNGVKDKEFDTYDKADDYVTNYKESEVDATKYSDKQLEGEKSNYKEVLVTLPRKTTRIKVFTVEEEYQYEDEGYYIETDYKQEPPQSYAVKKSEQFNSSHWSEPNILVHLRMSDRIDSEGNKVLHISEIQSDFNASYRNSQEMMLDYVNKNENEVIELYKKNGKLKVEC